MDREFWQIFCAILGAVAAIIGAIIFASINSLTASGWVFATVGTILVIIGICLAALPTDLSPRIRIGAPAVVALVVALFVAGLFGPLTGPSTEEQRQRALATETAAAEGYYTTKTVLSSLPADPAKGFGATCVAQPTVKEVQVQRIDNICVFTIDNTQQHVLTFPIRNGQNALNEQQLAGDLQSGEVKRSYPLDGEIQVWVFLYNPEDADRSRPLDDWANIENNNGCNGCFTAPRVPALLS